MGNSVMLNGGEYAGEQIAYKDSTYELVSKVAYLIGVPLRIFQNEHEPPKIEIYDRLEQDKNARIIRNLCIIRTAIERNYRKINDIMRMEYRGLLSMPEILPMSSINQRNLQQFLLIQFLIYSLYDNKPVYRLLRQSIRRLTFVPPYSVFCSISFRCGWVKYRAQPEAIST